MTTEAYDENTIVRLSGSRVDLACFRSDDEAVKIYQHWMCDEEALKWIGRSDKLIDFESQKEWALQQSAKHNPNKKSFNIVSRETGHLIGNCSLTIFGSKGIIGIFLDPALRSKGFGKEALEILITFGFNQCNLHKVCLDVVEGNEVAIKLYESLGFEKKGIAQDEDFFDGEWHNTIYMELMRKNFFGYKYK